MLGPFKRFDCWLNRKQIEDVPRRCDEMLKKILRKHEQRATRDAGDREDKDLKDILLQVHQVKNAEFNISRSHMKAVLMVIFVAGADTSTHTMEWVIALLINHPKVFKKLRGEIELVVGRNELVEESDIPNLNYLRAAAKETMRLYLIGAAILRECREDCKVGGFDIPKKTTVVINAYSIMRDPELWDNPNEFCPKRFLQEQDNQNKTKRQNFNFLAFGWERSIRPHSHFAFSLINIAVASMVQCFERKVGGAGDGDGKVNMAVKSSIILSLKHPRLAVVHFNPFSG